MVSEKGGEVEKNMRRIRDNGEKERWGKGERRGETLRRKSKGRRGRLRRQVRKNEKLEIEVSLEIVGRSTI